MVLKSGAPNGDNIEMAFVYRIYLRNKLRGYSFFVLLVLFLALVDSQASAESGDAEEVRAIWVTRWDYRSAGDIRAIIQNCKSLGLNRIYFQVRGRSDAFYRSSHEPWAEELGGRDPGFDPLAIAVSEAGENAMQLHAWANVLAGWKGKVPPENKTHLYYTHPDWFLTDRGGKTWKSSSHYSMLNPCNPEVRKHLAVVLGDLVARYKIDGLHLDYIRFVFPDPDKKGQVPYDMRGTFGPQRVPTGHLFMMGDNRGDSQDSRYWGALPMDYVKGRAFVMYWSYEAESEFFRDVGVGATLRRLTAGATHFFTRTRWERILMAIP